jgi:ABC-2 type transport system permease protein
MEALLLKNFLRSKGLMTGLLILFVAGLISLHIGKHFLDKNKEIIEKTAQYQQESITRNVEFHPKEIGLLLYYVRFWIGKRNAQFGRFGNWSARHQSITTKRYDS